MSTHEEITSSVNYEKGYNKGFSDAQEKLSLEFNRVLIIKEDLAYEKGFNAGVKNTETKYKDIYDPNKRKPKG